MPDLAGSSEYTATGVQLYSGEAPTVTTQYVAATGVTLAKYEVFAVSATGEAIKFAPGGVAPATVAVGIAAQPAVAGGPVPAFTGGAFNPAALVWPTDFDAYADQKAAFQGTDIHIQKLL